ncbi:MAG: hypothetical protein U1F98_17250, partial [Verrucomicrobiota bacterium]
MNCITKAALAIALVLGMSASQGAVPVVAIHDSELTRALETMPAANTTPTGPGTTGNEWWTPSWHYFFMPESLKEALRSDGTAYAVVGDADIAAGSLLDAGGQPKYPILISLASEAVRDDEIAALTNYVAAGGTLFIGSSSFTRQTNGVSRGDFALANQMGVHMVNGNLLNWAFNFTLTKLVNDPILSHIPGGRVTWDMPTGADEIPWGTSPVHARAVGHLIWQVAAGDASVIAQADSTPYILVKNFGKGRFIYDAQMQPVMGRGGDAPGMHAYTIFRRAIEEAFAASKLTVPKLSPWPYSYDAAMMVRHDLENFQTMIRAIEASAQFENASGVKGEYYFCTGTLREEMTNSPAVVGSLRSAITNYGALISSHNGGFRNPNNSGLVLDNYDYWHWGPDEAIDAGVSGINYSLTSISNSFLDVEGWFAGITNSNGNGKRTWVSPYFNSTREPSLQILESLNIRTSGEQKISIFPSWVLSTSLQTAGKRYPFISLPLSEWYINGNPAETIET